LYKFQENRQDTTSKRDEMMSLFITDKNSYFISANRLNLDTILLNVTDFSQGLSIGRSQPKSHIYFMVKKDYAQKICTYYEKIGFNNLKEVTDFNKIQWNLNDKESKLIGKYSCKKATTQLGGRTFEAWYTEEIPIAEGPYKFANLPGLILELYDNAKHHYFAVTQIERKKRTITFPTEKWEANAQNATMKEINKVRENPNYLLEPSGNIRMDISSPEIQKRIKENIKKRNNPIEVE
jgi:GLPGLI family protein